MHFVSQQKSNLANTDVWSLHNSKGTNTKSYTLTCSQQYHLLVIHGCLLLNAVGFGIVFFFSYCYLGTNISILCCSSLFNERDEHKKPTYPQENWNPYPADTQHVPSCPEIPGANPAHTSATSQFFSIYITVQSHSPSLHKVLQTETLDPNSNSTQMLI